MKCTLWSHCFEHFEVPKSLDGLTNSQIASSLDLDSNINKIFKAGMGAGASGSFFFFSHDNKLIIKTIISSEKKLLQDMLVDINDHIEVTRNKSLLARIYGLYSIKSAQFQKVSFVLMQNTI